MPKPLNAIRNIMKAFAELTEIFYALGGGFTLDMVTNLLAVRFEKVNL